MSDELDIRIDNDLAQNDSGNILGSKTIEDVIKKEAKEEQEPSSRFSISRTLGGVIIARFAQRQMNSFVIVELAFAAEKIVSLDIFEHYEIKEAYSYCCL
jgi:hypothetical protein